MLIIFKTLRELISVELVWIKKIGLTQVFKMGKNKGKGKAGAGKGQFVPAPPRTAFDDDEPRIVELPNDFDEAQEAAAKEKPDEKEKPKKGSEDLKKEEPKKEQKPVAKEPEPEKPAASEDAKKQEKPKIEETKQETG